MNRRQAISTARKLWNEHCSEASPEEGGEIPLQGRRREEPRRLVGPGGGRHRDYQRIGKHSRHAVNAAPAVSNIEAVKLLTYSPSAPARSTQEDFTCAATA